jgi:hypothetical protein
MSLCSSADSPSSLPAREAEGDEEEKDDEGKVREEVVVVVEEGDAECSWLWLFDDCLPGSTSPRS